MAKHIERLTPARVTALRHRGQYPDGDGLYLVIDGDGNKSWIFRYWSDKTKCRSRYMGLGNCRDYGLKEARQRAADARRLKLQGIDPIDQRDAELANARAARRTVPTFEQAAVAWHEKNRGQWAEKTQRNWISSMRAYAFPVLGKLLVSAVTTAKVLEVIEPIWTKKRKTATQVRARIESVLAAQRAAGLVSDNVAEWSGHLDAVLPAPSKIAPTKRHASVPYVEMPGFMADLRAREGLPARALEFLILTGVRSNEALGAEWSEIDLENAVWKIPGSRMKMKKDHSVPLTDRALAILRALPRETAASNFVFIGARKGGHLGRNFLPELMDDMGRTETVHGFRTSLRSWAGDCSDTPSDVCEAALAHYPTGVEAAYMRSNQLEKRRALMNAWSEYCGRPPRNATVTPLRPQRIVTEQISVREGA